MTETRAVITPSRGDDDGFVCNTVGKCGFVGNDDGVCAACTDFLRCGAHKLCVRVVQDVEEHRHSRLNKRERSVFECATRVALRMDVADFFYFSVRLRMQ